MIAIATSTRADWGLLKPLADELRTRGENPLVIATFMHLFEEQGFTVREIIADGYEPLRVSAPRQPSEATAAVLTGFASIFRTYRPDAVIVLGDRFEMLGVASAALIERIPLIHIAGGTVSAGAIDDSVRNAISQLADLHFPETDGCADRLKKMGIPDNRICVTGAMGVWNAMNIPLMSMQNLKDSIGFDLGDKFILGTLHPATLDTLSPVEQMSEWLNAISDLLNETPGLTALLTYPNSDTDTSPLIGMLHKFESERPDKVKVISSLGRVRYLSAAKLATIVTGNSSSGIVEVPSTGTPVVDCGIRQEGRERSAAVLHSPLEQKHITETMRLALSEDIQAKAGKTPNPYYKPGSPVIIAESILQYLKN